MHRSFNLLLIFLCLFSSIWGQESKEDKLINILKSTNRYADIEPLIPILKKYPYIYNSIPMGTPLKEKYTISSSFGSRYHPVDKVTKFHAGIDLVSEYASTVHATADGKVIFAGRKGGYGKCVIVEHRNGFKTIYGHLTIYYTKKGKEIKKGTVIGFLGSTGKSTGNHLHYEIQKNNNSINPIQWMNM